MEHLVKLSCEVTWRYKIYLMNFWTSRQNVENISRLILVAYKVNERKTNLEKNTHTVYRENFVGILRGQRLLRWKPELFLIPTFSSQKKILKWRHGPKIRIRSRVWPSYLLLTPFKEWSQGPVLWAGQKNFGENFGRCSSAENTRKEAVVKCREGKVQSDYGDY